MEEKPVLAYLFTSPTCPHCPAAKRFAEEYFADKESVEFYLLDATDPRASEPAQAFGVQSVPTFILVGSGKDRPVGISGTPSAEHMDKVLALVSGE